MATSIILKSEKDEFLDTKDISTVPSECPFSGKLSNGNNDEDVRKFHILDETDDDGDDSDRSFTDDSDIPDDEIEKMLEEALDKKRKRSASGAGLGESKSAFFIAFTKFIQHFRRW